MLPEITRTPSDRDEFHRRGGHELENEPGEEGVAQHLHRALPNSSLAAATSALFGATAEQLERGEALHGIQETRAHARERPPLAAGVLLRIAADEDHQDRNDRAVTISRMALERSRGRMYPAIISGTSTLRKTCGR